MAPLLGAVVGKRNPAQAVKRPPSVFYFECLLLRFLPPNWCSVTADGILRDLTSARLLFLCFFYGENHSHSNFPLFLRRSSLLVTLYPLCRSRIDARGLFTPSKSVLFPMLPTGNDVKSPSYNFTAATSSPIRLTI